MSVSPRAQEPEHSRACVRAACKSRASEEKPCARAGGVGEIAAAKKCLRVKARRNLPMRKRSPQSRLLTRLPIRPLSLNPHNHLRSQTTVMKRRLRRLVLAALHPCHQRLRVLRFVLAKPRPHPHLPILRFVLAELHLDQNHLPFLCSSLQSTRRANDILSPHRETTPRSIPQKSMQSTKKEELQGRRDPTTSIASQCIPSWPI